MENRGELLCAPHVLDKVAFLKERSQGAGERGEGILSGLGSDAEIARPPAAPGVEPRREAREDDRRFSVPEAPTSTVKLRLATARSSAPIAT